MSHFSPGNPAIPSKSRSQWPVAAGIGLIVLTMLIYLPPLYKALGSFTVLVIYDVGVVLSASIGAFLASRLWRSFDRGETLSRIWGGIALGLILWAGGEIIWSSDQLWGGNSLPYPSAADVLWILGYIPVVWALVVRYRTLRIRPDKWWQIAALATCVLLAILAVTYIMIPIVTDTTTTRLFEKTVNLLYPIGDLIVTLITVALVLVLTGGTLFGSWGFIAIGFLCAATSDLLYALAVWQGNYQANPPQAVDPVSYIINVLYVASYVFIALGLYREASTHNAV